MDPVRANPITPPQQFSQLFMGLFNDGTDIQHVRSNVSIDVYDFESIGHGDYLLRNHNDSDVVQALCFSTGPYWSSREEHLMNVSLNGTSIAGTEYDFLDFYSNEEIEEKFTDEVLQEYLMFYDWLVEKKILVFEVNITASSDVLFSIDWSFVSGIHENYNGGMFSLEQQRNRQYYTGYTINGGKYWNNRSIESEKISFYFHTDKFYIDEQAISVNISSGSWRKYENSYEEEWESLVASGTLENVEETSNGLTYSVEYTDIIDNIHISIINDFSSVVLSPMIKIVIGVVACAAIIFVIYTILFLL